MLVSEADFYTKKIENSFKAGHREGFKAGQRAANQWQPIETAPKDGTWILAWDGNESTIIKRLKNKWVWNLAGEDAYDDWTHWMHTPEPPEKGQDDADV